MRSVSSKRIFASRRWTAFVLVAFSMAVLLWPEAGDSADTAASPDAAKVGSDDAAVAAPLPSDIAADPFGARDWGSKGSATVHR